MNLNASFIRKIIYIAAIALLWIPLFFLGLPAEPSSDGTVAGSKLARLRAEHNLSQAKLGEIDPASESMKLATLGMRGVAANILWHKANQYKKMEDWDSLSATLNQITKLQPNFISVWEFQAHNLSYNVSVEFDDYRHRYQWVKKGIDFLITGTRYNRNEPRLLQNVGWFLAQKMGHADEKTQYRRLFREDHDFHNDLRSYVEVEDASGPDGRPDNWLVGRLWYVRARDVVDDGRALIRGKSPLLFYSYAPMARIKYSEAIESEGYLDEKAQYAWQRAGEEWAEYGRRQIPTSRGFRIQLADITNVRGEIAKLTDELDQLAGGVHDELRQEKVAQLLPEEQEFLNATEEDLKKPEIYYASLQLEERVAVAPEELAEHVPSEDRDRALQLVVRLKDLQQRADMMESYRTIVNFGYWATRCDVEQSDTAIKARKLVFEADQLYQDAVLVEAKERYEQAWDEWAKIFDEHPRLIEDVTAENLAESVGRYQELLSHMNLELPEDFQLRALHERYNVEQPLPGGDDGALPGTADPAGNIAP